MAGPRKPSVGQLDKRVTFQSSPTGVTSPATGGVQPVWVNLPTAPTVWARVESVPGGDEFDEHGKLQPRSLWKVTIRRRTDLTTKMRVQYGASTLYIKTIGDTSLRSEFVEITCTEYPS